MTLEEFRLQMEAYWKAVDEESRTLKDSHFAVEKMQSFYRSLGIDDREMANKVLSEWLLSPDEALRFDALALVDDFRIVLAIPTLTRLAKQLASSSTPGAPFELQKVKQIADSLAEHQQA